MCFWQNDKDVLTKNYEIYVSNSDQKEMKFLPQNKVPKVLVSTLRMQFWQQNRKNFATKWKEIRTKSGAFYETFIFLKNSYPLNDPLDTYSAFLTTSPNCLNCFPQRSASNYLIITFQIRKSSTIVFSEYIELICDSNTEKSLLKKWIRTSCFNFLKINSVFLKVCSSGDSKHNIDNQAGNFVPKIQKDLPQTPKKNRRRIFQDRYFAKKCPLDFYYALLITLLKIFLRNWEFFAQNPTKLHIFPRKTWFFYKVLCWLLQCNFDNPAGILIDNCVKLFCRKPEFIC